MKAEYDLSKFRYRRNPYAAKLDERLLLLAHNMSPTIFREAGFRFYFFSREEPRMHVHVHCADGEAKFWIEPRIELAQNIALKEHQLHAARALVEAHTDEIRHAWQRHFGT
jgi:hypothetical protein